MIKIRIGVFMKYYSDEFKNNIVKLYQNENRSKKSLASEYGAHPTIISHWIKRAKLVELPDGGVTSVEAFKQLQKENQQLKEENEILKAAAVLLGRH